MKIKKKRKVDPFWPILLIFCMAAFGLTFHFAHTYTSEINTKTFETTDQPLLPSMKSDTKSTPKPKVKPKVKVKEKKSEPESKSS